MITIDDFMNIELRTARIQSAERVEGTDKLMRLIVQVGDDVRGNLGHHIAIGRAQ